MASPEGAAEARARSVALAGWPSIAVAAPRRRSHLLVWLAALGVLVGCGGSDLDVPDAGGGLDATVARDAGADARAPRPDGSRPTDAGGPDGGSVDAAATADGSVPEGCPPDRQPPAGMERVVRCDLASTETDCRDWADFFNGVPGSTGIRHIAMNRNQYMALELNVPDGVPAAARSQIGLEALQAWPDIPKGQVIWTFSRCPGDFNAEAIARELEEDCVVTGIDANFGIRFGGSDALDDPSRCALSLPPGTTYYLNMLFTEDDPWTTPSTELTWSCGPFSPDRCGTQVKQGSISGW
jgi:hypothetical protein